MADRRAVRASSRLKTPTPQPPSKASTPRPAGRATRKRTTRSASTDAHLSADEKNTALRRTRGTSVISLGSASEQENDAPQKPRAKRKAPKEAIGLTTVEEVDTQIDIQDPPSTPPQHDVSDHLPHRSPGAVSEMSGTTAISSFSMMEVELPAPNILIRKLPKLYDTAEEFLNHLVPENGGLNDDHQHIRDMQMPDSDFSAEYRILDEEASVHLSHFRGEYQRYILRRTVHRALLGPNRDADASRCGLDLIIYLANLLIFAKQAIHSDRNDKETWDSLRELDNCFPTYFLPRIVSGSNAPDDPGGGSALLQETFELALDLRTQLAILYLERSSNVNSEVLNPDGPLDEVFFQSEIADRSDLIRGWGIAALGGEDSALPQAFQGKVIDRINTIREFFPSDEESIRRGEVADIDGLSANFPWDSLVLRLLGWVRSRNQELQSAIRHRGGIKAIVAQIKTEMERPSVATQATASRESPRKKRTSFLRNRRRNGKFNPNADVDTAVVDMLIAKENEPNNSPPLDAHRSPPSNQMREEAPAVLNDDDDWQPPIDHEEELAIHSPAGSPAGLEEEPVANSVEEREEVEEAPSTEADEEPVEPVAGLSQPPQSTAETLTLFKKGRQRGKENRGVSLFDRQPNARRVEFGDGFGDDSQSEPERSHKGKGRQQTPPPKRARPAESDDDDDEFETMPRTARVQEQRERAKRVRAHSTLSRPDPVPVSSRPNPSSSRAIPSSSHAPTSHQPQLQEEDEDEDYGPATRREQNLPENGTLEMMEDAPPPSTFSNQRELARANNSLRVAKKTRKQREEWTPKAEEALIEYMAEFPRAYAQILKHDEQAYNVLQNRTQVNLKDKVRNMAIVMIKSGAGLRPGFEGVVSYDSKHGRALIAEGFQW